MTEHSEGGASFRSRKFTDWPTVKEALIARQVGASFLLAPMAMQLRQDGIPVKVVYLGHRDGSTLIVAKDGPVQRFEDLRGRRVAVPNRYSNQNILLHRIMKERGMPFDSLTIVELPPPEHPTALHAGTIDAFIVGEPFCAKAELDGVGRVLYFTKDIWKGFISCVLVVHEDTLRDQRELVQELVTGIARSGKWLDEDMQNRMDAAEIVGKHFYFQPPELLAYVLSRPVDRVQYTRLEPLQGDFDEIMELAVEMGILSRRIEFLEYADPSFAAAAADAAAWDLERMPGVVESAAR